MKSEYMSGQYPIKMNWSLLNSFSSTSNFCAGPITCNANLLSPIAYFVNLQCRVECCQYTLMCFSTGLFLKYILDPQL